MADFTVSNGNALMSGPDGVTPFHRYTIRDPTYIGEKILSPERTGDVRHIWRGSKLSRHPTSKASWVGAVGWNVWSYNDWRLLKSNHQIKNGPFRTAALTRFYNDGVY